MVADLSIADLSLDELRGRRSEKWVRFPPDVLPAWDAEMDFGLSPGVRDALLRLQGNGHTVHLVTARGFLAHGDLIKMQTLQWISDYAIPHDTLTFAKDKTLVRTDVFADDAEHNLSTLTAAGVRTCLIDAPHNQHVMHDWRAPSFADFVEELLGE